MCAVRLRYMARVKSTGGSSQKFGPCEIFREPVSDVWFGSVDRVYMGENRRLHRTADGGIDSLFGHEACVRDSIVETVKADGGTVEFVAAWPARLRK
jgi:hypothetical protein